MAGLVPAIHVFSAARAAFDSTSANQLKDDPEKWVPIFRKIMLNQKAKVGTRFS